MNFYKKAQLTRRYASELALARVNSLTKLEPGSQTARVKPWLTVILGQVTKRLDFGARKCIGGTANLARKKKLKRKKLQASSSQAPSALK